MNLNTKMNKTTAVTVPVIMIVLFSIAFFVLEKTPITITAYIVGLLGAVIFGAGNLYFINAKQGYPWIAAIPMSLWRYVITATLLSAVFVIGELIVFSFTIPVIILVVGHILIFAFYFLMLLLMHTGKKYIEEVDEKIEQKRQFIKEVSEKLNIIKLRVPASVSKDIQTVIEKARYSDPMSCVEVQELENNIFENIKALEQLNEEATIREMCNTLLQQLTERNSKIKTSK